MKFNRDKFNELLSSSKTDFFNDVDKMIENEEDRSVNAKIAMRLFDYMEEKSMSRKQLAERLGISPQYLCTILNGKVNITVAKAVIYGNKLRITLVSIPEISTKSKIQSIRYKSSNTSKGLITYSGNNIYSSLS